MWGAGEEEGKYGGEHSKKGYTEENHGAVG